MRGFLLGPASSSPSRSASRPRLPAKTEPFQSDSVIWVYCHDAICNRRSWCVMVPASDTEHVPAARIAAVLPRRSSPANDMQVKPCNWRTDHVALPDRDELLGGSPPGETAHKLQPTWRIPLSCPGLAMTLVSRTSQEGAAHDEQLSNLESSHLRRTVKSS